MKDYIPMICWAVGVLGLSSAIATACYVTKSGWPLLAFIFTPTMHYSNDKENKDDES